MSISKNIHKPIITSRIIFKIGILITIKLYIRSLGRKRAIHAVEKAILYTCLGIVYLYPFLIDKNNVTLKDEMLAIKKALAAPIKP